MTPKMTEEDLKAFAKAQIPPRRSFVVRLYRRSLVTSQNLTSPRYIDVKEDLVEMFVEAHNHAINKSGALYFSSTEWHELGLQGPGLYTFTHYSLAPETWYDCRETTQEMQVRAAAN